MYQYDGLKLKKEVFGYYNNKSMKNHNKNPKKQHAFNIYIKQMVIDSKYLDVGYIYKK